MELLREFFNESQKLLAKGKFSLSEDNLSCQAFPLSSSSFFCLKSGSRDFDPDNLKWFSGRLAYDFILRFEAQFSFTVAFCMSWGYRHRLSRLPVPLRGEHSRGCRGPGLERKE